MLIVPSCISIHLLCSWQQTAQGVVDAVEKALTAATAAMIEDKQADDVLVQLNQMSDFETNLKTALERLISGELFERELDWLNALYKLVQQVP